MFTGYTQVMEELILKSEHQWVNEKRFYPSIHLISLRTLSHSPLELYR